MDSCYKQPIATLRLDVIMFVMYKTGRLPLLFAKLTKHTMSYLTKTVLDTGIADIVAVNSSIIKSGAAKFESFFVHKSLKCYLVKLERAGEIK